MKKHKILASALLAVTVTAMLAGCGDDTPSKKQAEEAAMKLAKNDAGSSFEVADFVRENGWQDTESANKYWVRYNYNLVFKKSLAELALETAKEAYPEGGTEEGFQGMANAVTGMGLAMKANLFIGENKDGAFTKRFVAFIEDCASCRAYLYDKTVSKQVDNMRANAFIASWATLAEEWNIDDSTKAGGKMARQATAGFMKTEKGWMTIN